MKTSIQPFGISLAIVLILAGFAQATDTFWQGTTGNWSTGGNWDNGEPGSDDNANINNGGTAQITLPGEQCWVAYLGISDDSGNISMSGTGGLSCYGLILGWAGTGTFTHTGGTNTVGTYGLTLGGDDTGEGTYELSGTAILSAWSEAIGYNGTGTFIQTGGTNTVDSYLYVGRYGTGTYQLSGGGNLSASVQEIGWFGTGTFTHTDGTNTVDSELSLGDYGSGDGTYNLSGTGSLSADDEYVGRYGSGTFIQSGGTNSANSLRLGFESSGNGTYAISNGTLDVQDGTISVGPTGGGTGTFNLNGGTVGPTVIADEFSLGSGGTFNSTSLSSTLRVNTLTGFGNNPSFAGSLEIGHSGGSGTGSYSLTSGQSLSVGFNLSLGYDAQATFTQNAGTNTVSGIGAALMLGRLSDGNGTYNLSGTGSVSCNSEIVGFSGTGSFMQTGGTNTVTSGCLDIGATATADGTYTISDGTLDVYATINVGPTGGGTGAFNLNGGTVIANQFLLGSGGTFSSSLNSSILRVNLLSGFGDTPSFAGTSLEFGHTGGSGSGGYSINTGQSLVAGTLTIGYNAPATCTQSNGTNTTNSLYLGREIGGNGTYTLSGGNLTAYHIEMIGSSGTGMFTQTNGSNTITNSLYMGYNSGSNGTYTIFGGSLSVPDLVLGRNGGGTLNISNSAANITVSNLLKFGANSTFTAAPWATIHMTGSSLENLNTDPADLAGLDELTLIFEGGTEDIDPVELAGEDRGAVMAGWTNNFALGTLTIGGANVGKIQLVNNFDNQPAWVGSEALYVTNLNIAAGSYLDLNGLHLYYLNGSIDPSATITGGSPVQVSQAQCVVDLTDFANFAAYWLETGLDLPADLYEDEDNMVNILDFLLFSEYWLGSCPLDWPL